MNERTAAGRSPEAERLFTEWLVRQPEVSGTGDEAAGSESAGSLEALCTRHPEHAEALRALHADYSRIANLLRSVGRAFPAVPEGGAAACLALAERIAALYGPGIDPNITLDPRDPHAARAPHDAHAARDRSSEVPSEVLSRLTLRPDTSGRYRIQGELARGGQGVILSVWDEDLRRRLAMKVTLGAVTPPQTGSDGAGTPQAAREASPDAASPAVNARSVGRFLEEAQVTSQLDHPGIVPVHELGLDQHGRVFFTMKLVKGEDLKAVFARVHAGEAGWSQTRALSLLLRVAEAMSYAHSKHVIHRDLKPSNIMVGRYGEVFVMDWGLARVLDRKDDKDIRVRPQEAPLTVELTSERRERAASDPGSPLFTMDGDVVGTPAYMSPEQASGKLERMGPPSDVYALGATLYHLLTGRIPYVLPDAAANNYSVLHRLQEGPPTPVASLAPQTPAELVAICEKAMARDPAARYPDMSAFAEDLRAYLERRVVSAYEAGAVAELRKWVERNKPLAAALAAGVVLLAAGLTASLVLKAQSDRHAKLALAQREVALEQERVATQKSDDVLSLSAIQVLKELTERAAALWPAEAAQLPAYEAWLAEARVLIDGAPADPARGLPAQPGLAEHESKLAEIRQRALPLDPGRAESDRRAHPRFAEWEVRAAELLWMQRMLGEKPWPTEAAVEAALALESLPADAESLNRRAWPLVDNAAGKMLFGREVEALLLARRALAVANDSERAAMRDTLAWALFRTGRAEDALAESRRAVEEADVSQQEAIAASLRSLEAAIGRWKEGGGREKRASVAAKLAVEVAESEREISERRTFEFADAQDRWWHQQLAGLLMELEDLTDEKTGLLSMGTSAQHGWGIPRRAEFARTIDEKTVSGPDAARRWAEAIEGVEQSPRYGGWKLSPLSGLLPIGPDPDSGLWEFWHLQSGDEPVRGEDGRLVPREEMGIVLVLIPGGSFLMGAQNTEPSGGNHDTLAGNSEAPVHEVRLSPYLLSKYELTQGQWTRFTGSNPSQYVAGSLFGDKRATFLNPVEQLSWNDAMEVLPRLGLTLPTEAQWERAARAGTTTAWSSGHERESLRGAANLADQAAARAGATWSAIAEWPELDDGWSVHSPVGNFRANPFGLHDMHGNVWELCLDSYDDDFYGRSSPLDPQRESPVHRNRVVRGGSYYDDAVTSRSANRDGNTPDLRDYTVGLRPAKRIKP